MFNCYREQARSHRGQGIVGTKPCQNNFNGSSLSAANCSRNANTWSPQ